MCGAGGEGGRGKGRRSVEDKKRRVKLQPSSLLVTLYLPTVYMLLVASAVQQPVKKWWFEVKEYTRDSRCIG